MRPAPAADDSLGRRPGSAGTARPAPAARRAAAVLVLVAGACVVLAADRAAAPRDPAPRVRLEPVAAFDTHVLLEPGAWSPGGTRLALLEAFTGHPPSGLAVFDAAQPAAPPRTIYDAGQWIRSFGWSPDGTWLLVLFGNASPENGRWLVAVPADGARPETLLAGLDLWPAAWGLDGAIHVRMGGRWRALAPPARWKESAAWTPRSVRAADAVAGSHLRLRDHAPGSRGEPLLLGAYFASTGGVRVLDALPDGSLALVSFEDRMGGGGRVVDASGPARRGRRGRSGAPALAERFVRDVPRGQGHEGRKTGRRAAVTRAPSS